MIGQVVYLLFYTKMCLLERFRKTRGNFHTKYVKILTFAHNQLERCIAAKIGKSLNFAGEVASAEVRQSPKSIAKSQVNLSGS
jgi:hypothetical protein